MGLLHFLFGNINPCTINIIDRVDGNLARSIPNNVHELLSNTSVPSSLQRDGLANVLKTTRTEPSFHMFVYPPDKDRWISNNLIEHGVYEVGTTKLMMEHLPTLKSSTDITSLCNIHLVLDMGSNLGYYSLLAASRGYDVVSFEASPDTAWLQRSSAALNGLLAIRAGSKSIEPETVRTSDNRLGSLTLVNKGVSDKSSFGRMSRYPASPGMTSFANETQFGLQPGTNGSALDVDIELIRAHDILTDLGYANKDNDGVCYHLLKIDVEGYELKALTGLGDLAVNYPFKIIMMEYFPSMLKAAGMSDPLDVLRYISKNGYEFFVIENDGTLSKVDNLEIDDRVKDIHGQRYHINLCARRNT